MAKPKVPPIAERKPVYIAMPKGTVKFSSLEKPDTTFSDQAAKWQVVMTYTPEEIEEFQNKVEALAKDWLKEVQSKPKGKGTKLNDLPFKEDKDKEGNETGLVKVTLSRPAYRKDTDPATGESTEILRPIPMFNAKGEPVTGVKAYRGATVRPSIALNFYASPNSKIGVGISFRLEAVQVIKASGGARTAAGYGFQNEDTEESDGSEASESSAEEAAASTYEEGQDL